MIAKELFCKALRMIGEQEHIDNAFSDALQSVGNGHFVFRTENKYRKTLLMVLKEAVCDRYDYNVWWLYEGEPNYEVWSKNGRQKWVLKEPEELYDFITAECS